jgi:hypothetical protein
VIARPHTAVLGTGVATLAGVSSLATAANSATSEPAGATPWSRARRLGVTADGALAALVAAGFAAIVFVANGGTDLAPNTWVEILLVLVGAASALAIVLRSATGRAWGGATVILFGVLAALTFASIAWSVQPADSWVEGGRTLSYLAAFGAAVALARIAPTRWPALIGGVTIAAVVVCGYALLADVFPATLNAADNVGRLRVPFGYWNATGLMAALGLPGCLWAGSMPRAGRGLKTLSVPALALLFTVLMLSYSRGSLIAGVIGLACWLAFVPARLRATLVLALGAFGGAIATGWALAHHAITHENALLAARTSAGHHFGLVLLAVLALSAILGLAAALAESRITVSPRARRRIGGGLLGLAALLPVLAIVALAASSRGLTGEISHAWTTLTSPNSHVGNNPGRIAELGNSRPIYWSEGLKVGEHALLKGVGAVGFDTARTRYTTSSLQVAHAHSYVIETFADFGLIGIAVSLALLMSWAVAVKRTLAGARGSQLNTPQANERAGLITLLSVALIFGVSSTIDWTWFVPGVAVPALVCAGWLAGRGPFTEMPGRLAARRLSASPGALAAGVGVAAAAIVGAWVIWQPLHSTNAFNASITAITHGNASAALADAREAASSDPVSVDPLWELSAIYTALGNPPAARAELVKAANLQPSNPETWEELGTFDLQAHHAADALRELQTALHLDLGATAITQQIAQAQSEAARAS